MLGEHMASHLVEGEIRFFIHALGGDQGNHAAL